MSETSLMNDSKVLGKIVGWIEWQKNARNKAGRRNKMSPIMSSK